MVRQAVIIVGGKAQRLRPFTDDRPKCMVVVGERMIIEWQLQWLRSHGITHVIVSAGHMAERLVEVEASEHIASDLSMEVVVEETPLGRGGGLRNAAEHLPFEETWIGLNGDILTDLDLTRMISHHRRLGVPATLSLAPYVTSWGIIGLDQSEERVLSFEQSPRLPYWINAGVYCFEHSVVGDLPEVGDHESGLLPELARQGRLGAFPIRSEYWRGIDNAKDLSEAAREMELRATPGDFSS